METDTSPFTGELPKKKNHKYIMSAVSRVLSEMEMGTRFSGAQLPRMVAAIEPKCESTEGETIRRYMRYLRDDKDYKVICVDRANSIYQKVAKTAS